MRSMMFAAAALTIAVVLAGPSSAQMSATSYAEANRPKMAARPLSSDERRVLSDTLRVLEKSPDAALLQRIQPMANAGDKAAMKAMIKGWRQVTAIPGVDRPADAAFTLGAQWGVAWFQTHGKDEEAAAAFADCFQDRQAYSYKNEDHVYRGKRVAGEVDCGFLATITPRRNVKDYDALTSYVRGKGDFWKAVTFETLPLFSPEQIEADRFEQHLRRMSAYLYAVETDRWVNDYVARTPGAAARLADAKAGGQRYLAGMNARNNAVAAPDPGAVEIEKALADMRKGYPNGVIPDVMLSSIELRAQRLGAPALNRFAQLARLQYDSSKTTLCFGGYKTYCAPTQQASAGSSDGSGYRGSDPNASTQALKDYNARVNAGNCARADKGAIISCGR